MQLHGQNGTVFSSNLIDIGFFTSPQFTTDTGNDTAINKGLDGEEIVAEVSETETVVFGGVVVDELVLEEVLKDFVGATVF